MLAARVGGDRVHRPGSVERTERHEVVELGGAYALERLPEALGLELEHADRLATGEHSVGLLVIERQRGHVRTTAGGALDDVERILDHVEVAQTEEVHLQQAHGLDWFHRELRDGAINLLATLVGAVGVGELHRHQVCERLRRDNDRGGMDRGVADDPLKSLCDLHDAVRIGVALHLDRQRLAWRKAILELRRASLLRVGDQLGQLVAERIGIAQYPGRIPGGGAREHLAEGDDLRHRIPAILVGHVLDHLFAATHREVDVDVRHRHALGVEEALEQQVVTQRVEVRDAGRVGDQ